VTKEVTGIVAGHNPANVFGITVQCPGTSSSTKAFNLLNGQSGVTDVLVGDTCTIDEPTVPTAIIPHQYAPMYPSKVTVPAGGRAEKVINEVVSGAITMSKVTFVQATVTDIAGSGYVPGSYLRTIFNWFKATGSLPVMTMREGDEWTITIEDGTQFTSAAAGTLPPLNAGFRFSGPTTTPPLPYTVPGSGPIMIHYAILRNTGTQPIPTLDPKALLLLIGLLSGAVFLRSRLLKKQANR
jgi:hypothetical protein